jgi:hypothetical protein
MCPGIEDSAGKQLAETDLGADPPGRRAAASIPTWPPASALGRGKKFAPVAVGHSILVSFCPMLKKGTTYAELGGDSLDRLEPERRTRYSAKRLQALSHKVALEPCTV